ncbi:MULTISPECIES: PAS domain-containing protein [Fischerella]|uniref:PAS domain-containing protein n=1 Tax=Fischerella TaxID=1190 RepID=UPI000377449D|nr:MULTISPECIES: PAS domain-containing protein [Fischerella]
MQRQGNDESNHSGNSLPHSVDFFRALSACCPIGIFTTDTQGRCTYLNPQAESVCGFKAEEILEASWVQFLHPNERESVMAMWVEAVFAGSEFCRECLFQNPQGKIQRVQVKSSQLHDQQGNLIGS